MEGDISKHGYVSRGERPFVKESTFSTELLQLRCDLLGKRLVDLGDFQLLLFDCIQRGRLLRFVHARTGRFFQQAQDFGRLHVQHLRDATLHDEEGRIADVELHGVEQILHSVQLGHVAVDQVLVFPVDDHLSQLECHKAACTDISVTNLTRDSQLLVLLVSDGAVSLVRIIEHDCHRRLRDTSLALFVDQFAKAARTNVRELRYSQYKANRIQDVGLSTATI